MTEIDPTLPAEVRRIMRELYERTDIMPVVTREGMCSIHLMHSNERVRMTQRYVRPVGSKRWRWHSSELWESGVQRPTVSGLARYTAVFEGTEDAYLGRKKIELPPLTPLPPGDEPPLGVQATVQKIQNHMNRGRSTQPSPHVGMEEGRYTIEMVGPLVTVRLYFQAHRAGSGTGRCYREDQADPLRVVRLDGTDITQDILDDPALRAAFLAGDTSALHTPGSVVPDTDTTGARSNAVETRRASVRRV